MLHRGAEVDGFIAELGLTKSPQVEIAIAKAKDFINFDLWGLDLSATPQFSKLNWLWLIPIIAGLTTYLSSKITTWVNTGNKDKKEETKPARVLNPDSKPEANPENTMKTMTYFMPVMTAWIAFSFPAALGLYWIISNVLSAGQTVLLNGYYSKKLKAEFAELEEKKAEEDAKKRQRRKKG